MKIKVPRKLNTFLQKIEAHILIMHKGISTYTFKKFLIFPT